MFDHFVNTITKNQAYMYDKYFLSFNINIFRILSVRNLKLTNKVIPKIFEIWSKKLIKKTYDIYLRCLESEFLLDIGLIHCTDWIKQIICYFKNPMPTKHDHKRIITQTVVIKNYAYLKNYTVSESNLVLHMFYKFRR